MSSRSYKSLWDDVKASAENGDLLDTLEGIAKWFEFDAAHIKGTSDGSLAAKDLVESAAGHIRNAISDYEISCK